MVVIDDDILSKSQIYMQSSMTGIITIQFLPYSPQSLRQLNGLRASNLELGQSCIQVQTGVRNFFSFLVFNVSFQFAISHGMLSLTISKGKSFLLQIFGYETCSTVAGTVFFYYFPCCKLSKTICSSFNPILSTEDSFL